VRPTYLAILRVPHARPLLLASFAGRLSFATGPLALVLFVQDATGSFARAGAASAATALTSGLLAPLRGRLIDRHGQRRCLPPFAVVYAAALAGVVPVARPGPAGAVATVALAGLAGAAAPPLGASMRVLWTSLLGQGRELQTAYALDAVLEEAIFTLGPLLAAGLAAAVDPAAGLLAAALLAVAGTAMFVASPVSRRWAGEPGRRAAGGSAMRAAGMRTLALTLAGVGAATGIWEIGLVAAASRAGSPEAGGILLALWSGASAVGGLWYGGRSWSASAGSRFLVLLALLAAAASPLPLTPSLLGLGVAITAAGLLLAPLHSSSYVLAAELAPAGTLTESATWVTTANNVTAAAGIALAGALVDHAGVPLTLAVAWTCIAAALLVGLAGRGSLGAARYRGRHEVRHQGARQAWRLRRML
jgi:MFS family permease